MRAIENDAPRADAARQKTDRDPSKRWAHLTERGQVGAGLSLLTDLDYLADVVPPAAAQGGRPKVTYRINPRIGASS